MGSTKLSMVVRVVITVAVLLLIPFLAVAARGANTVPSVYRDATSMFFLVYSPLNLINT